MHVKQQLEGKEQGGDGPRADCTAQRGPGSPLGARAASGERRAGATAPLWTSQVLVRWDGGGVKSEEGDTDVEDTAQPTDAGDLGPGLCYWIRL